LTGSEAITMSGVADIASGVTRRPIRRVVVPDDEFRAGMIAAGAPEATADLALGMFRAGRRGEFAPADPTLNRLIGRKPVPLRDVLKDALAPAQ